MRTLSEHCRECFYSLGDRRHPKGLILQPYQQSLKTESMVDMSEVYIAPNLKQCKIVSEIYYPVTNGPLRVDKRISPASELVTVFSAEEPAGAVSRVSEINIPDAF